MHLKLRNNNKAVGTVFGMIFFLLIVVVVFAGFAVVLNQSTLLENAMIQTRQLDNEKAKESFSLKSASNNGNSFVFIINNTGVISGRVVRLWVEDEVTNYSGSAAVSLDQRSFAPNDQHTCGPVTITIPGSDYQNLRYWFVTDRGNQFTFVQAGSRGQDGLPGPSGAPGPTGSPSDSAITALGIGRIGFDFDNFRYYTANSASAPTTLRPGTGSGYYVNYNSKNDKGIVFEIHLTNVDPDNTINLNSETYFFGIKRDQGTYKPVIFNMCTKNGNNIGATTTIALPPKTYTTLYFIGQPSQGTYAFNLCLAGKLGSNPTPNFGQNIPFVIVTFVPI